MYKITLVNMPFADIYVPSIGLTQLKEVVESKLKERATVEVLYLNHDFAHYMGLNFYNRLVNSMDHHITGLGDWFFRQVAFPHLADNTEAYFQRCYPALAEERLARLKNLIREKRRALDEFLNGLVDKYRLHEADMVGFTSVFNQNVACIAMARKVKDRHPAAITVIGGANCEASMGREMAKHVEAFDYVFSGPALKGFPLLVEHCIERQFEKCDKINGVFSKANCNLQAPQAAIGKAVTAQEIGEELDINTKIPLDYEPYLQVFAKNFPAQAEKVSLLFETSRGCWWGERSHCTFCGLNGLTMEYRVMNPPRALELFDSLFKYAARCQRYQCVDNIMPKNYVSEVLPFINTPPDATIFYEVKADLGEEELGVLARAGVRHIQPGIEALATSTLKLMKKGISSFQNLLFLKNCIMHEVRPSWNLLIGFPGEQEEVFRKYVRDLPLLTHLMPPTGVYPVRFDRFSPYFTRAQEYELDLRPVDYYELTYPFNGDALARMAYYFVDYNFDAEYLHVKARWISPIREKINDWLARWFDGEQTTRPKLYFKNGGASTVVYDSRRVQVVEHNLSEMGKRVLQCLSDRPRRLADIAPMLSDAPGLDVEREMNYLQSCGLVFEEGGRFLNLVHDQEPPDNIF
jgi:ribosomal peptide maturation radical SAM protein 1